MSTGLFYFLFCLILVPFNVYPKKASTLGKGILVVYKLLELPPIAAGDAFHALTNTLVEAAPWAKDSKDKNSSFLRALAEGKKPWREPEWKFESETRPTGCFQKYHFSVMSSFIGTGIATGVLLWCGFKLNSKQIPSLKLLSVFLLTSGFLGLKHCCDWRKYIVQTLFWQQQIGDAALQKLTKRQEVFSWVAATLFMYAFAKKYKIFYM